MRRNINPVISIIIPTRNRPISLQRCLLSLASQRHQHFERLVIVDDCSDNSQYIQTLISNLDSRIVYIHINHSGPSIARMIGLIFVHPKSDYVVFIDDDCVADTNFLKSGATAFLGNSFVGCGGIVKSMNNDDSSLLEKYHTVRPTMFRPRFFPNGNVKHLYTCNSIFKYSLLSKIGVSNPIDLSLKKLGYILLGGEDSDLSERILINNYKLGFCPDMVVYHKHRVKLYQFLKQNLGYGRGLYLRRHSAVLDINASKVTRRPSTFDEIISKILKAIPYRIRKIYRASTKLYKPHTAMALTIIELIRFFSFWAGAIMAKIEYIQLKEGFNNFDFK